MKLKTFIAALVLIFVFSFSAFAIEAPKSIRGIKWGTPLSKLSGMTFSNNVGNRLEMYTKIDDKMNIGAIQLLAMYYNFLDGKFSGCIMVLDKAFKDDIVAMLKQRYGKPKKIAKDSYAWIFGAKKYPFTILAEPVNFSIAEIYRVRYCTPKELEYMFDLVEEGSNEL